MAALAPQAFGADTLTVAVAPGAPEQGIPATFTFSGTAAPIDSNGNGPALKAEIRPSGGLGCQGSYTADRTAEGAVSTEVFEVDTFHAYTSSYAPREGPGSFKDPYTFALGDTGGFLLCAYLENDSNTPTATASLAINVTGPVVSQLQVGLQGAAQPGIQFLINYTTQTDQQLTLYSVVQPAGGQACPASYELAQSANLTSDPVDFRFAQGYGSSNQVSVYGGPSTAQAAVTETKAGAYVVCTWVEGPNTAEVVAAASTPFNVGSVPQPPPPQCVVPSVPAGASLASVEQRIRAANCAVGQGRYAASQSTPRGAVIRLSPATGTQLAAGSPVDILVSTGPPPPPRGCVVPAFAGTHLATFERRIRAAHCRVGRVVYAHSKRGAGVVLSVNPGPGARRAAGSYVNIRVSSGHKR